MPKKKRKSFKQDKKKTVRTNKTKSKQIKLSKNQPKQPDFGINPILDELKKDGVRLNKYLSNSGIASRRKADELIKEGHVQVNDVVVLEMGYKVQSTDVVKFKGKVVKPHKKVYILLNKPKDVITTTEDPQGRKTVMDLVAKASNDRLYPVGRLDRNTTGLLVLTNDGELAQKLAHPSKKVRKLYHVVLDKPLTKRHMIMIAQGLKLEDGVAVVDDIAYVKGADKNEIGIQIHIGKNRIVRRIFEHLDYKVKKLDRVTFAGLTKKDLPRGRWRYLTKKEVIFLMR